MIKTSVKDVYIANKDPQTAVKVGTDVKNPIK